MRELVAIITIVITLFTISNIAYGIEAGSEVALEGNEQETSATCGGVVQCNCGDTLTESQTMWYDLENSSGGDICPGEGIIIGTNNLVLDCNGHSLTGIWVSENSGISANFKNNITIKNCYVKKFTSNIRLDSTTNSKLSNNIINDLDSPSFESHFGILLFSYSDTNIVLENNSVSKSFFAYAIQSPKNVLINNSGDGGINFYIDGSNNVLINNSVVSGFGRGILISGVSNITMRGNKLAGNWKNLNIGGTNLNHFLHSIDTSNTINGKSVYYLIGATDLVIDSSVDPGYVGIVNGNNVTIEGLSMSNNGQGVLLVNTNNSNINNIYASDNHNGIILILSNNNSVKNNSIISNDEAGINLKSSMHNLITDNNILGNTFNGASLTQSQFNTFWNNTFANLIGSANEDLESNNNSWNLSNKGNSWHDFANNPGYPNYYKIPGDGDGIDWHPIWEYTPQLDPIGDRVINEGNSLTIDVNATDKNNDVLTYYTNAGDVLPSSFTFNSTTGLFTWTPTFEDSGNYSVTFNVTDSELWDSETIIITVYDVNFPPSTPTILLCDGQPCTNNETFFESLEIACFGSIDPELDEITYEIDAFYDHSNPLILSINTFNNSLESENITITGNILFENKFSNGLSTETLVFTQNENIVRYLDLPKFSDVKASNLTITGYDPSLNWIEDPSKVSGITGGGLQAYPETFFLNDQHHLIIGYQGGSLDGYTWNGNGWTPNSTILNGISIPSDFDHHHVHPSVFNIGNDVYLVFGFQVGSFIGYKWTGNSWISDTNIINGLALTNPGFSKIEGFNIDDSYYAIVPRWDAFTFVYEGYIWTGSGWTSDSTITSGLSGEATKISVFQIESQTYMIRGTGNAGGNPTGLNWSGSSWVSYPELVTGITSTGERYNTLTVFNLSSSNFGLVLMDEGSNKKGFDLQLEYGPTNPYLEVGTIDGNREWQSSGIYHDTEMTTDFTNQLNSALNGGSCDCSGCSLSGDTCSIPFTFHSDTKGKLEYKNIFVEYDPEGTGAGKNEIRYLRIPKDVNVISATMNVTNYNTNNPYIEIGTPDGNYEWNYSGQLPELIEISANSITRILQAGIEGNINNFMDGDQSTYYQIDGTTSGVLVKFTEMNYTIQEENPENLKWHFNWTSIITTGVFTDQRPSCIGDTGGLLNIACYYNWSSGGLSVMWFYSSSPNEGHIEKQIQPDGVTENGDISVTTARFFTGTNTIIHYYETWVSYQKSKFPVDDFSTELNSALNNCDCVGCNLDGDFCEIPFIFHSDVPGDIIEYSNLNVTYELSTYWENIGNHTENFSFNWNISNITPQSEVDLRCRAIDLNGSGIYSDYYDPNVNITIIDQNPPPVLDPLNNVTINENETLIIDVNATDANLDVLTYYTNAVDVLPSPFTFDSQTGLFEWTPTFDDSGNYSVIFNVTDGNLWDSETIIITVYDVNFPPSTSTALLCDGQLCINNETFFDNLEIACFGSTDPEGDLITYQIDAYYNHSETIEDETIEESITAFNNSLERENLTFQNGENITRYLEISKYANVTTAYLNLSGFSGIIDVSSFEAGNDDWTLNSVIRSNEWGSDGNYSIKFSSNSGPENIIKLLNFSEFDYVFIDYNVNSSGYCGEVRLYEDCTLASYVANLLENIKGEVIVIDKLINVSQYSGEKCIYFESSSICEEQNYFDYMYIDNIRLSKVSSITLPTNTNLEIGTPDGTYEWSLKGAEFQGTNAILDELNDTSTVINLTYSGDENQTVYLKILKHANVASAFMNLSGFELRIHNGFGDPFAGMRIGPTYNRAGIFFNLTGVKIDAIAFWLAEEINPAGNIYVRFRNLTDDSIIYSKNFGTIPGNITENYGYNEFNISDSPEITEAIYILVERDVIEEDSVRFVTANQNEQDLFDFINTVKYNQTHYLSTGYSSTNDPPINVTFETGYGISNNPYLEVGTPDGIYEWNHSGVFNETFSPNKTFDFSSSINSYLSTCSADLENYCDVPLLLHSDTAGILQIDAIEINYTNISKTLDFSSSMNTALNFGACDCVGCSLNGNQCTIPFSFHSDSAGILEYSNINITYQDEINVYSWENIGNHTENSSFNWNISNITPQSEVDLRCRAIDLNGSVSYSEYYQPGINITIIEQFPPVLDPLSNVTVDENETLIIDVNATDANNDVLTYYTNAVDVLPSSSSFDSVTGLFIWIPEFYDAGEYYVTFNVTDGNLWDNETITITVISNTQPGENVSINLTECSLNVTFDNITTSGTTLCETSSSGPSPPGGFQIIPSGAPIYYILNSTANFTGNVTVCFEYNETDVMGPESNLKLRHFDGGWIDITIQPVDTVNNIICGETDHFSYFAVMEQSYICGDIDDSGTVDIIDLTYMVDWMFRGGLAPQPLESADMNGDGQLDISDLTYFVDYIFGGGSAPVCDTTITMPGTNEYSDTELLEAETTLQEAGFDIVLVEEEVEEPIKLEPKLLFI